MPPRFPHVSPGEYYHVVNRGAGRQALFLNTTLYQLFLHLAEIYAKQFNITIVALCLMPNHFHLVVRIEQEGSLAEFMQMLCGVYSRKLNRFFRRTGTLFEGRYFCKHVTDDAYFKRLCPYVHLNPVRAALVQHPGDWDYSTYLECVGERSHIHGAHDIVTDIFGGIKTYRECVMDAMKDLVIRDARLLKDLNEMRLI